MKQRPLWLPTAQVFLTVALVLGILFDVQDCRELMAVDIFSPELKQAVYFEHLYRWIMWGVLIIGNVFSLIVWNWPKERIDRASTAVLAAMLAAWAATALIPGFISARPLMWWFVLAILLGSSIHEAWKNFKSKKATVSSP